FTTPTATAISPTWWTTARRSQPATVTTHSVTGSHGAARWRTPTSIASPARKSTSTLGCIITSIGSTNLIYRDGLTGIQLGRVAARTSLHFWPTPGRTP